MPKTIRRTYEPIPGTVPPPRALFVDRWGTLFTEAQPGRRLEPGACAYTPGAVDALFRAVQRGWRVYLIGNEDAVARGRIADAEWHAFEASFLEHLRSQGVSVSRCYACLDHPQGRGTHARNSVFRLPDTGLFFHAAQVDGVDLSESWVIGDSTLELAAATRAGCRAIGVRTGLALGDRELDIDLDRECPSLSDAISLLLASEVYARP